MISQWLRWTNYAIAALIVLLLVATGFLWVNRSEEIVQGDLKLKPNRLPKSAFELDADAYKNIDQSLLALQSAPPTLQIPDLKNQLIYYGKNGRPDAQLANTSYHFSVSGNKTIASIAPGDRLYLVFDKKSGASKYVLSPNNGKTSLWIEAKPAEASTEILINVFMENDKGEVITEPKSNAEFKLTEKEFIRYAGVNWELGTFRVDGTLLARMRAKWHGPDKFLENHGGEQYAHATGKQRIDFGEGDDVYSVFVEVGDCLIWDSEASKWKAVQPGVGSQKYPLLVAKKMEERLMSFELWDMDGKGKIALNMLKSTEPTMIAGVHNIHNVFKFVGARTKTQCVFEINNERIVLSPSDWLLLTPKGWKKLSSEEEIDDYVNRKTTGSLFVFEKLGRKDEKQVLIGMIYNPSRCDCQEIELSLQPHTGPGSKPEESKETKEKEKELADALREKIKNMRSDAEAAATIPQVPSHPRPGVAVPKTTPNQ